MGPPPEWVDTGSPNRRQAETTPTQVGAIAPTVQQWLNLGPPATWPTSQEATDRGRGAWRGEAPPRNRSPACPSEWGVEALEGISLASEGPEGRPIAAGVSRVSRNNADGHPHSYP